MVTTASRHVIANIQIYLHSLFILDSNGNILGSVYSGPVFVYQRRARGVSHSTKW